MLSCDSLCPVHAEHRVTDEEAAEDREEDEQQDGRQLQEQGVATLKHRLPWLQQTGQLGLTQLHFSSKESRKCI